MQDKSREEQRKRRLSVKQALNMSQTIPHGESPIKSIKDSNLYISQKVKTSEMKTRSKAKPEKSNDFDMFNLRIEDHE